MKKNYLSKYAGLYERDKYLTLHQEMSFAQYLELIHQRPKIIRTAYQRLYDMIMSKGISTFERYRKTYTRYKFFDDHEVPIFGLEEPLDKLVNFIQGAAGQYGTERRVLLLHGPVGSSKSTICRLVKRGLERFSETDDGAWYTHKWVDLPVGMDDAVFVKKEDKCPMHEEPIKLMPLGPMRQAVLNDLNQVLLSQTDETNRNSQYDLICEGDLCPRCRTFMSLLLKKHNGNWEEVVENHIRVVRQCHSESDRVGIGTFQPKDEKNQDATELTGDLDFAKLPQFGSDSDARAFNFDGELNIGNRGLVEFIEILKLDNQFLYDLLGVSQEHNIKPKKFAQISVDEVVVGHTNGPEYDKLMGNRFMEALRDRTTKIDIPYLLRWSDELKILKHIYANVKQHLMPHTLEIAAFFAILTRLKDDREKQLDLRDKVKLYDDRSLENWSPDSVKELRDKYPEEGIKYGVSARYLIDKISNCLARNKDYVNCFHVLHELKEGLRHSSLIDVENIKHYEECIELSIKELNDILKAEVNKAVMADEGLNNRICSKYIQHLVAFVQEEKVQNPITKQDQDPDERMMRSIEEKIDISDGGSHEFRRSIAASIGSLATKGKDFKWDSNPLLARAFNAHIFDLAKDSINIGKLSSEAAICDPELQGKIDAIKHRLIRQYKYNEKSATDVLDYVSSLYNN